VALEGRLARLILDLKESILKGSPAASWGSLLGFSFLMVVEGGVSPAQQPDQKWSGCSRI
jgi:hypothetical protein